MNVELLIKILFDAQLLCMCARITHRRLSRFFHYVAELSSKSQIAASAGQRCFDVKNLTAGAGPRQASGDADLMMFLLGLRQKFWRAEKRVHISPRNSGKLGFSFGHSARHF